MVLNTVAVAVGAFLVCAGLSALAVGYDYYVNMKEADEQLQDQLEELGLSQIPGVDDLGERANAGLAASLAGAIIALVGGVILAYGLLKKTGDIAPRLSQAPGATNFCGYCGTRISPGAASCPCCGRQIDRP